MACPTLVSSMSAFMNWYVKPHVPLTHFAPPQSPSPMQLFAQKPLVQVVPLLQVLLAVLFRHKRGGRVIAGIATLLALLFALPNLMTLSIVLGGNSAAHAGQRIMDVEAPGFRGASLVGAIIAVLVFVGVVVLTMQYRRRGRQLAKARAR